MSNTTTIARGWKLTRRDGQVLAFTDCDVDLTVDGVTYLASAALTPSEAVSALGMAVDEQEVQGAVTSAAISEVDLAAGLYDDATVEVIEIDWTTEARAATVGVYYVGQVARTESSFAAELRSSAGILDQARGRYTTAACDADLGDARCGVALAAWATCAVTAIRGGFDLEVSGLGGFDTGIFNGGSIVWTTGQNVGQVSEVRTHAPGALGIWRPPLSPIVAGDTFELMPGCDRSFRTCIDRFANGDNFRGFPTITGEAAMTYATYGDPDLDGESENEF